MQGARPSPGAGQCVHDCCGGAFFPIAAEFCAAAPGLSMQEPLIALASFVLEICGG